MNFDRTSASRFDHEPFEARGVSETMLCKLIQAEKDGERFWQGVSNRIRNLSTELRKQEGGDPQATDRGLSYMTPIAKIQIGLLASAILLSMLVSILMLTIKAPSNQRTVLLPNPDAQLLEPRVELAMDSTLSNLSSPVPTSETTGSFIEASFPAAWNSLAAQSCKVVLHDTVLETSRDSSQHQQTVNAPASKHNIIASQNRLEHAVEPEFPNRRYLNISVTFNKSGYGRVSVNGETTSPKIGPTEIAQAIPDIGQEIAKRMAFIGPRIGVIHGVAFIEANNDSIQFEYSNLDELEWATGKLVQRLAKVDSKYRRRSNKTDPVQQCLEQSTRRINRLFQEWAQEAMESGGAVLRVPRDRKEKYSTIIGKEDFEEFSKTGKFRLPILQHLFLPVTTIQRRDSAQLKHSLANAEEVSLFADSKQAKAFSDAMQSWKNDMAKQHGQNKMHTPPREPLKEMLKSRVDLQGLPLVMGEECRMETSDAKAMNEVSRRFGPILNRLNTFASSGSNQGVLDQRRQLIAHQIKQFPHRTGRPQTLQQYLRTADQMLQIVQPDLRYDMVQMLAADKSKVSASLLTCYAKYDLDAGIRMAATKALANYKPEFYRAKLLEGLEYPWVEAAQHSAEAIVRLNDTGSIPYLVDKLRNPDPRIPVEQEDRTYVKREMVAVNHMKNCLLCHADSNSPSDLGRAPVPEWDRPLPALYYQSRSIGLAARADVTYMRQDFSVMLQTQDRPKQWPENQRYDFVVRERVLDYNQFLEERDRIRSNDNGGYRRAIIFALQMLTDENPVDNSYHSWHELTKEYRRTLP